MEYQEKYVEDFISCHSYGFANLIYGIADKR